MDGDKELIDKLQHVWHSARPFPQEPWDRIIALVREHDGPRWDRLHSASKNTRAWMSRNGLDGNSAYDDLVAALDAIPQSAEPPAPAAEPQFIESMWPGAFPTACSICGVSVVEFEAHKKWHVELQKGGA